MGSKAASLTTSLVLILLLPLALASQCNDDSEKTDSGGEACSYYAERPHHCGCCDTAAFSASDCCACQQQSPVVGNATWWTAVFQGWPGKATSLRLPGRGIQAQLESVDFAGRWPALTELDLSGNQLTGGLPSGLGNLPNLSRLALHNNQLSGHLPTELGHLTSLQTLLLYGNQLSGSVPSELGRLSRLQTLWASLNQFSGALPAELGNLKNMLSLSLHSNDLSGALPSELGKLTSLRDLYLHNNRLSGALPADFGNLTSLQTLSLSRNELSGSLPPDLGRLTNLQWLYLYDNRLQGGLPAELGKLRSLQAFESNDNQLSSSIPSEFGSLRSLQTLRLDGNQLTGAVPAELGNLTSLRTLSLYDNHLSGSVPPELGRLESLQTLWLSLNELTGGLPAELGSLADLQSMSFHSNGLGGELPRELGRLTNLQELYLYNNQLGGSLPSELGSLTSLHTLSLYNNQFSGVLPVELGRMTSLRLLSASGNQLSGALPPELGNLGNLQWVYLQDNHFHGSLPAELGKLASLQTLSLSGNELTGILPPELGKLANLREMYLYNNQITGRLPTELSKLVRLRTLSLYGNQLSGSIPGELGRLSSLQTLWLSRNQFSGALPAELGSLGSMQSLSFHSNDLSGTLPPELGKLTSLQELYIYNTRLAGALPAEFGNLTSLQTLSLFGNQLNGELPPELGKLTSLTGLYLYDNHFQGNLPVEIGSLVNLRTLSLFSNDLSGTLPPQLGNLTSLEEVYLYSNHFTGGVPAELGSLASLRKLSLFNNQLNGSLPAELGRLTNLQGLYVYHNQLQGGLPAELGKLTSLEALEANNNQLTGELPPEIGNLTSLQTLYLNHNVLSGAIPREIGKLMNLRTVWLNDNQLSGGLPAELGNLAGLDQLRLDNNHFSGGLPAELGNLTSLTRLSAERCNLSGGIPPELGKLVDLQLLRLPQNHFSGPLPVELGNMRSLRWLHLWRNQLSGTLPPELGKLTRLATLFIYRNQFTGPLPRELGNLRSLTYFQLFRNSFTGILPAELGNLPRLWSLYLYNNQFTGTLPAELGKLPSLTRVYMQNNRFTGPLPPELGNVASLQDLNLQNNGFSGPIPQQFGHLANLESLDLSSNRLSGSLPAELGNLSKLRTLVLEDNQLSGGLPGSFRGLARLRTFQAARNPRLCGEAEVVTELFSLERLDLRGCCFEALPELPAGLEYLDLGENHLSQVPRRMWEQPLRSLTTLRLDGNAIAHWETSSAVPLTNYQGDRWACWEVGPRFQWTQLQQLDVSANPLGVPVYDFLATLSYMSRLTSLRARDANLTGPLPEVGTIWTPDPFVPNLQLQSCSPLEYWASPGFTALTSLDLSGNRITAVQAAPPTQLVQGDLSRNALSVLESRWWSGGLSGSLQQVDVRGNPELRFPVLLEAGSSCPPLGAALFQADVQGWGAVGAGAECTRLCPLRQTRLLVDATANESVLCRCTTGQGTGLDCSPCPDNTFSGLSFKSGRYTRACEGCPAESSLRSGDGLCFADCICKAGHHMAQIENGTSQDVGSLPCHRLAPLGGCLSCGLFKTSAPGSRKEADCFCNSNVSSGGWGDLLEREGRCGCPEGFHMNFLERRCVECQTEEDCGDWTRSLEPPRVRAGFWALPSPARMDGTFGHFSRHSIWRCDSPSACPGGSAGCGLNRTGVACSLCKQLHFRTPSGGCVRCSRSHTASRRLLLGLLLPCVAIPMAVHFQLRADARQPHGFSLTLRSLRTSLKQLLKFGQILGLVSLFRVEWPPLADSVFAGARAVSLDFAAWTGVACLDLQQQQSMTLEVTFRWALPLAGMGLTCLAALLVTVAGLILGPLCRRVRPRSAERLLKLLRFRPMDVLRVLVFFLHLLFPSLLKNALLPLTCSPSPNGLLTMNAFPHVVCWQAENDGSGFWTVAALGLTQSVLLCVGFPLLLLFAWRRVCAPATKGDNEVLEQRERWWSFIFVEFRLQKRSWVLVAVCKDIVLNLIVVCLPGFGSAQLLLTSAVCIGYACKAFCVSPYPDLANSLVETCTSAAVATLCLFSAGMGFQSEPDIPDLGENIAGGRTGPGYLHRAISLVCLQGFAVALPLLIVAFQLLMAIPACWRRTPECIRPLSDEQRVEWSKCFTESMKLDGGPLPLAVDEFDAVDFSIFRRAVNSAPLAKISLRQSLGILAKRKSGEAADEEADEEVEGELVGEGKQVEVQEELEEGRATLEENKALRAENAELRSAIEGLHAKIVALCAPSAETTSVGQKAKTKACL